MFLTNLELFELSKCVTTEATIEFLIRNSIPYRINAVNELIVMRRHVDAAVIQTALADPFTECLDRQTVFFRRLTGIYFLLRDGEVVYIGKTTTFFVRMAAHDKQKYEWDEVVFIPIERSKIDTYELEMIARYDPPLNKIKP